MIQTRRATHFDTSQVIDIATEMSASVRVAAEGFAAWVDAPADNAISPHIKRAQASARLGGLRAAGRLLEACADLARRIEQADVRPGSDEIESLRLALGTGHQYLQLAASGRVRSGVMLYPAYSAVLRCLPGKTPLSRSELFMPLVPRYGAEVSGFVHDAFVAEISRYLGEFSQGRARFAERQDVASVTAMRTTLATMEAKGPPASFRVLFGLAISFLDVAIRAGGQISPDDQTVLGGIEQALDGVSGGRFDLPDDLVSRLMHAVGQAAPFSARIRTLQEQYALARMVEEDAGAGVTEQALATARSALDAARHAWESATTARGDTAAARAAVFQLASVCSAVGDHSLKSLSLAMGSLADSLNRKDLVASRELGVFGASILLSLAERLGSVLTEPRGGRQVAEYHKERVRALLQGKPLAELTRELPVHELLTASVVGEAAVDLQAAEGLIDQCLRDGVRQNKLDDALALFGKAGTALRLINNDEGLALCDAVSVRVRAILAPLAASEANQQALAAADRSVLASIVLHLHQYVAALPVDGARANAARQAVHALLDVRPAQAEAGPAPQEAGTFDACTDDELGPIFVDEARDVLRTTIVPCLERLARDPSDESTLLEVRRGFHTLKGSSRMVGLMHLGLAAQHAEFTLNVCRDDRQVRPNEAMLGWLREIATLFESSLAVIEAGEPAPVDAARFAPAYEAFQRTHVFGVPEAAPQPAEPATPAPEPQPPAERGTTIVIELDEAIPDSQSEALPETLRRAALSGAIEVSDGPESAESGAVNDSQMPEVPRLPASLESQAGTSGAILSIDSGAEPGLVSVGPAAFLAEAVDEASVADPVEVDATLQELLDAPTGTEVVPLVLPPAPVDPIVVVPADTPASEGATHGPVAPLLADADGFIEATAAGSDGSAAVGDSAAFGGSRVSSAVFAAFLSEVTGCFARMDGRIRAAIEDGRTPIDRETMRCAHSLAGMGRTTGISALASLASAIEQWCLRNIGRVPHLDHDDRATLADALEALEAMIQGISDPDDPVQPVEEHTILARLAGVLSRAPAEHDLDDAEESVERALAVSPRAPSVTSVPRSVAASDVATGPSEIAQQAPTEATVPGARYVLSPSVAASADSPDPAPPGAGDVDESRDAAPTPTAAAPVAPDAPSSASAPLEAGSAVGAEPVLPAPPVGNGPVTDVPAAVAESAPDEAVDWLAISRSREDDVDADMFEIFADEGEGLVAEVEQALAALREAPEDQRALNLLKRALHTLKGSANTTGARKIGALFHHLEDVLEGAQSFSPAVALVLEVGTDVAFEGLSALRAGRPVDAAIERLLARGTAGHAGAPGPSHLLRNAQSHGQADGAPSGDAGQNNVPESVGESVVESIPESIAESLTESLTASTSESAGESIGLTIAESVSVSLAPESTRAAAPEAASESGSGSGAAAPVKSKSERPRSRTDDEGQLRIPARVVEEMMTSVGEINIARNRLTLNLTAARAGLEGLSGSIDRMYGSLREVELEADKRMSAGAGRAQQDAFDALQMDRFTRLQELTRRLAEAQSDVMSHHASVLTAIQEMEGAASAQNLLMGALGAALGSVRRIRIASIVPALKRVVRQACRETGRLAEVNFDADIEIDRGILDRIALPLEHVLRNAVTHGIESPEARRAAGKPETGTIEIRASQLGGEVVMEIRDDGAGIDAALILTRARDKGLVRADAQLSEEQVRNLIFEPGFSTAEQVTELAGRGVGLDVVRSAVSSIGGRVSVAGTPGAGSAFTLRLPATLTVLPGAAVRVGEHVYIVPAAFIGRLARVTGKDLKTAYRERRLVLYDGSGTPCEYRFYGLSQIVGVNADQAHVAQRNSVILMRGERIAVHVDEMRPASDYVFRPLGGQVSTQSGLIGSTIGADGRASLIIDPVGLVRAMQSIDEAQASGVSANAAGGAAVPVARRVPLVMIVDDSITIRSVVKRLLKREGYRWSEAENGMAALEAMHSERPDVVLMDVEMPRMNGYEATRAMRAAPELRDIPIVMITSRVGEVHRKRAEELGVNAYLGKPYNDAELIGLLKTYTGEPAVSAN